MKKTHILIFAVIGFSLISGTASAITTMQARSGTMIPLQLQDYIVETDTPLLPDWQPSGVKFYLVNPYGQKIHVITTTATAISSESTPIIGSTKWKVNADGGYMKIPAFATVGNWEITAKFYDKGLFGTGLASNILTKRIAIVNVLESSFMDSLVAPMYMYLDLGFAGEFSIGTPDLIVLIGFVVLLIIVLINARAFLSGFRRKTHA
jgi:hypothetical protein